MIELCKQHNIQFVCLPPHSTDKMQPLDVGVFSSMKSGWRAILTAYKQKHPNKTEFPSLLKQLMDTVKPGRLLPKAFEKCGLYPVNQEKPMQRIPSRHIPLTKSPPEHC